MGDPMDRTVDPDLAFALYGEDAAHSVATVADATATHPGPASDTAKAATTTVASAASAFSPTPGATTAIAEMLAPAAAVVERGTVVPMTLADLLALIAMYNAGGYGCDGTALDCAAHPLDCAPMDWRISLSELLRAVQFYQAGGYAACTADTSGYCPVFD